MSQDLRKKGECKQKMLPNVKSMFTMTIQVATLGLSWFSGLA
jgi:hypothetical protein